MPAGLLPAWTLNNHDAQRAVTRFGRADAEIHGSEIESVLDSSHAGRHRHRHAGFRAAALFVLGLPGCVYLYAGEELGLPEVPTCRTRPARTPSSSAREVPSSSAMAAAVPLPDRRASIVRVLAEARRIRGCRSRASGRERGRTGGVIRSMRAAVNGQAPGRATPDRCQPASRCCSRTIRTWWYRRGETVAQHVGTLFQTDSSTGCVCSWHQRATQASRHRRAGFGRVVRAVNRGRRPPAVS